MPEEDFSKQDLASQDDREFSSDEVEEQEAPKKSKPRIKSWEWILLFLIAGSFDLFQIAFEWLTAGIGATITPFLDIGFGATLGGYFWFRGQKFSNPKRLVGFFGTYIAEFIPFLAELPLWCLDVLWNWWITRLEDAIEKATSEEVIEDNSSED